MTKTKLIETIDQHYQEDLFDKGRLSSYVEEEGYQLLFLRQLSPKSDDIDFQMYCFLFKDKAVYQFERELGDFTPLKQKNSFFDFVNSLLLNNKGIVQTFSSEIEALEENLYSRNFPNHFIDMWFDLRNELSKIDRHYFRLVDVIEEFQKSKKHQTVLNSTQYQDLISMIEFTQAIIKDELSRLDILHHYYLSIKGDRLNKSIFILTVISGLFLPLNLVVGFFGMNTENLFFKDNPAGTHYVFYILLGLLALLLFFIPIYRLFDRLVLNYLLGKIDFYKKLSKKFDKFSETFKVE
ncbi:MAG: hypothetical protein KDD58_06560 [Bdellovibrionales bacterium]|nr:hypothetical protein [Bdellovibrionales bacterium]